jgi:hypothetical protein
MSSWDKIPAAKESSPEGVGWVTRTGISDPTAGVDGQVDGKVENANVED